MSKPDKIEIGDEFEFEFGTGGIFPRWNFATDYGGGGKIGLGKVIYLCGNASFRIEFLDKDNFRREWTVLCGPAYDGLWDQPGYFKKVKSQKREETKCECGSVARYGPNPPGHSSWCKLYTVNPYTGL